jgi:hypothetical protein
MEGKTCFWEIHRLHLQGWRISQAMNQLQTDNLYHRK